MKRNIRRKNGKAHSYWALVESYRENGGSRHRVVAYLGELTASQKEGWARLQKNLDGEPPADQLSMFQQSPEPEWVHVNLSGIRVEHARDFGDIWLVLLLWEKLGLRSLFDACLPQGKEAISWSTMVLILVAARFCDPSSELHIEDTWYLRTALPDLLGAPVEEINTDRLYRAMDVLLPHKDLLEQHLKERMGSLFHISFDFLLYDVTSAFFEGQAEANPKAKRGHSRDHRPDCKQVCIGLVVTTDGMPLGYEVFAGNRHDSTTLEEIVEKMEKKYGKANRIWVMDRGIASEKNLGFIRRRGGLYVVGTPKAMLRRFEKELLEKEWTQVQEGIEVRMCRGPEGDEHFVLCRSRDRREKERAIHERFVKRIREGLLKLKKQMESGHLTEKAMAERKVGKLLGQNSRAAGLFDVEVMHTPSKEKDSKKSNRPKLSISWTEKTEWKEWAALSEGAYLLRTNWEEGDPVRWWKTYIQLTHVEGAFRTQKSELKLRPIWHQLEQRVDAHILICFLAYVLWKTLEKWMSCASLGDAPRTLVEEMHRIKAVDVVLPTDTGKIIRLPCVTTPDAGQKVLLYRLGMPIPSRLQRSVVQKLAEGQICSIDFSTPLPEVSGYLPPPPPSTA
ncbi:MAG: IS1634 family transposase [Deltaproteobacteria bacterium]|nr:IS1634 family transposase [Deltaproteobacteria bacterium]